MIYFTSDTHFGHTNIIKYCNRPFKNVHEMNETMISNWNSVVKQGDTIYHLGDFAFMPQDETEKLIKRLNGNIHLLWGNHDKGLKQLKHLFTINAKQEEIYIDKQLIVLHHYACRVWNKSHRGSIMLYGHSHGNLPGNSQSLDVGVDCWDYTPVSFDDIKRRLKTLPTYVGYQNTNGDPKAAHIYHE